jgi:gamma-glutamylcysteine synthetase
MPCLLDATESRQIPLAQYGSNGQLKILYRHVWVYAMAGTQTIAASHNLSFPRELFAAGQTAETALIGELNRHRCAALLMHYLGLDQTKVG